MATKDKNAREFTLENFKLNPLSSLDVPQETKIVAEQEADFAAANEEVATEIDSIVEDKESTEPVDPIFKELSAPKLPELKRENRARLQMQSPTRIHFYWSFKQNPFQTLNRVFGRNTNYQLIAKLVNQSNGREELFPIEADGAAWFDVDADSTYQAEIGFYAVSRPFVRVMFSNKLTTPRRNPSPRQDYSERFAVSANQFAEVLDVSGFSQDAFEVALAGDDLEFSDNATNAAFAQITGDAPTDFDTNKSSEMRFVLLALASGYSLEDLREHISPSLFHILQSNAEKLNATKALTVLQENFGIEAEESFEVETLAPVVFGASLINFPRVSRRKILPKFSPLSSLR